MVDSMGHFEEYQIGACLGQEITLEGQGYTQPVGFTHIRKCGGVHRTAASAGTNHYRHHH